MTSITKALGIAAATLTLGAVASSTLQAQAAPAPSPTTTSFTIQLNPVIAGRLDVADVSVGGNDPSGTVTLQHGATEFGRGVVSHGRAVVEFRAGQPANVTLTATYDGDAANAPSTSGVVTLQIRNKAAAPIHWSFHPGAASVDQHINAVVSVLAAGGLHTPTGRIQLVDLTSGRHHGLSARYIAGGKAAIPYTPTAPGTYTFRVVYSGDSYYNPGQSGVVTLVVR